MKKRRLALFILNFLAAALVVGGAWLAWWRGAFPAETDFNSLLSPVNLKTDFLPFSVAIIIFVAAGLFLVSAIFANKFFAILGILLSAALIILWGINSKIDFLSGFSGVFRGDFSVVGFGVLAMCAALIFSLISLFIPKKREKLR